MGWVGRTRLLSVGHYTVLSKDHKWQAIAAWKDFKHTLTGVWSQTHTHAHTYPPKKTTITTHTCMPPPPPTHTHTHTEAGTDLWGDVWDGGALQDVGIEEQRNVNAGESSGGGRGRDCGQGRVQDVGGARGGVLGLTEQGTLGPLSHVLWWSHCCKHERQGFTHWPTSGQPFTLQGFQLSCVELTSCLFSLPTTKSTSAGVH